MKIGFIGAGNMATAMIQGMLSKGFADGSNIMISRRNAAERVQTAQKFGILETGDNVHLVKACDVIILAVKPYFLEQVIHEIKPYAQGKSFISVAAGWSFAMLKEAFSPQQIHLLRVTPNTPALVGEGVTAICEETTFIPEHLTWAKELFGTLGTVHVLPERLFDAVVAVSGSSPAYVYAFIEAMGDGAVRLGLPRAMAYEMAAQAVLGAAKMVLSTGTHPGALKDAVCSPAGSTIEAMYILEKNGFRGTVIEAMDACNEKLKKMAFK